MLTVLESIKLSTEYLEKKEIESPRVNAELLLAHILKCKRLQLYLSFDKPLQEDEIILYRNFIKRRGQNEPLQYILGIVEFYGLEFKVNSAVLIPRPETEILVETIIENLGTESNAKILDIGTGSGNIPICLAKFLPHTKIFSIDKSKEALQLAEENAVLNEVDSKIEFIEADIFNLKHSHKTKFDVIVSNPPYVNADEYKLLQPELKVFEPRMALTDEKDGLNFYRSISAQAEELAGKNALLYFEIGKDQYKEVEQIMLNNSIKNITIKKDYQNIERIIYGDINCEP